ncbi:MAG: hypothetical protein AB1435_11510 [Chloroflexota bacterium]
MPSANSSPGPRARRGRWARLWAALASLIIAVCAPAAVVGAQGRTPTPPGAVTALVAVERAFVFPAPDRSAAPLTYVYQRERLPVLGQTASGVYLLVAVEDLEGWVLAAQMDVSGDLAAVPVVEERRVTPTLTFTPFRATPTAAAATRTPLPTRTPVPTASAPATPVPSGTVPPAADLPAVLPGKPPPLRITLPEGWNALHLEVPFSTFDGQTRSIPLTIYVGPLPGGVQGYIYLYWGFPNVVDFDGEFNLWADGIQILRGSLVGSSCNLGLDEQMTFTVGGHEGVGTYYAAVGCADETDTTGWFAALRVDEGSYAFFTAVEPFDALADQRGALQAILDTVEFTPPDAEP